MEIRPFVMTNDIWLQCFKTMLKQLKISRPLSTLLCSQLYTADVGHEQNVNFS